VAVQVRHSGWHRPWSERRLAEQDVAGSGQGTKLRGLPTIACVDDAGLGLGIRDAIGIAVTGLCDARHFDAKAIE
jgi:hypothetical protein